MGGLIIKTYELANRGEFCYNRYGRQILYGRLILKCGFTFFEGVLSNITLTIKNKVAVFKVVFYFYGGRKG